MPTAPDTGGFFMGRSSGGKGGAIIRKGNLKKTLTGEETTRQIPLDVKEITTG